MKRNRVARTALALLCGLSCMGLSAAAETETGLDAAFAGYEESRAEASEDLVRYVESNRHFVMEFAEGLLPLGMTLDGLQPEPETAIRVRRLKDDDILRCYRDNGSFEECLSDEVEWRMAVTDEGEKVAEIVFDESADGVIAVSGSSSSNGEKATDALHDVDQIRLQSLSAKGSLADAEVTSVELVSLGQARIVAAYIRTDEGDYLMPYNKLTWAFAGLNDGTMYTVEDAIQVMTEKAEENAREHAEMLRENDGQPLYGAPMFMSEIVSAPPQSATWWIIPAVVSSVVVVAGVVILVLVVRRRAGAKKKEIMQQPS